MRADSAWLLCAALLARETVATVQPMADVLNNRLPRLVPSANTTSTPLTTSIAPGSPLGSQPGSPPSSPPRPLPSSLPDPSSISPPNLPPNSPPNSPSDSAPTSTPSLSPTLAPQPPTSPTPSNPVSESDDVSTEILQETPSGPSLDTTAPQSISTGSTSAAFAPIVPAPTDSASDSLPASGSTGTASLPIISSGTMMPHNTTGSIKSSTRQASTAAPASTSTSTSTSISISTSTPTYISASISISEPTSISTSSAYASSSASHSVHSYTTSSQMHKNETIMGPPVNMTLTTNVTDVPTPKNGGISSTETSLANGTTTTTVTFRPAPPTAPIVGTSTTSSCRSRLIGEPVIEVFTLYTSTVTVYGGDNYTLPYATEESLESVCEGSRGSGDGNPTGDYGGGSFPSTFRTSEGAIATFPDTTIYYSTAAPSAYPTYVPTVTLITTSKNPAVVRSPGPKPGYDLTRHPGYGGGQAGDHKTAINGGGSNGGGSNDNNPGAIAPPPPTFQVRAGPDRVVINKHTFTGLGAGQTSVVTVDHGTFTIGPTAVVGEGATLTKPAPTTQNVAIATPTRTNLGGVPVTVYGTQAIVGDKTMVIPQAGTTTVVGDKTIFLGPGTITVDGQGLTYQTQAPSHTDFVVAGGELLTAKGHSVVVVHSTTFTYGPDVAGTTEVVDDDTVTIGPSGVRVHGSMMGGGSLDATQTAYEVVGGATISKIAPSEVVINGATFKVGPGAPLETTVIGGETLTIGPSGLTVSTLTMSYPFGSFATTTITPTGTWLDNFPATTQDTNNNEQDDDENDDEDDGCGLVRPDMRIGVMCLCIAIGVWVLG